MSHPLYDTAARIMESGDPSPQTLERLFDLFEEKDLPMPVDLTLAFTRAGFLLPDSPSNTET